MKIGLILILMIVTLGILVVPTMADTGEFTSGSQFVQEEHHLTFSGGTYGGVVDAIYFKKIDWYNTFSAIKYYAASGTFTFGNVTDGINIRNYSYGPAKLKTTDGLTTVSTGLYGFARSSLTGEWYLYYFANTWTPGSLTGAQILLLEYNATAWQLQYSGTGWDSYAILDNETGLGTYYGNHPVIHDPSGWVVEYNRLFLNRWENTPAGSYDTLEVLRDIDGVKYTSRIQVNSTSTGSNLTLLDTTGTTNIILPGIPQIKYYLTTWDPKPGGITYSHIFYETGGGINTWDLNVIVRDASTSGLYDGATVTKTDLTDPYYNGWGTTYSGRVTFQAITGHEYNFSASAVGYTIGYANYSAITPINPYVSIWIYPIGIPATGYGYLDFMVRDSVGNTLEQAQVHLTDGQTKYTLMGYTRFNVTASAVIGYSVMKENYNTVTGNITSTTGTLTIPIILYNTGEGPTPTPTLDRRTSQQKFIDAGAIFANNAELFASLIVMAVMISLIDKVTLGSLSRAFGGRRKGK